MWSMSYQRKVGDNSCRNFFYLVTGIFVADYEVYLYSIAVQIQELIIGPHHEADCLLGCDAV
jgi:hypothetical protein